MSASSTQYSLSGTPRSGSKPPLGSRTRRRSTGNGDVRGSTRTSPSGSVTVNNGGVRHRQVRSRSGSATEGDSAEEDNRNRSVKSNTPNTVPVENIQRPRQERPTPTPNVKSVRGTQGKTFNNAGNIEELTKKQLIQEIIKREKKHEPKNFRYHKKDNLINELRKVLSNKNRNELGKRVAKKREALEKSRLATVAKKREAELKAVANAAEAKKAEAKKAVAARDEAAKKAVAATTIQSRVRGIRNRKKVATMKAKANAAEAKKAVAAMAAVVGGAAIETAKRSMEREMEEYKGQMQLTVKQIQRAERAKTKQKEENLHKYAGLMAALVTKSHKDIQKLKKGGKNLSVALVKKNEKLALMKAEKNKQLALATKKLDEMATKIAKRDNNFSKKNILDFISKRAKSNNRLTKRDILEFLSKQKTPTVTVKQSIGNVKAEGGKSNVKIENSKKLNREALLAQNIKQRDANYRRVVTTDPLALKRQKRAFAKKRGELLKSIQKIIKSDRKTSPKIKKKVYDSYAKSPRDRISKLLKLPKRDLISMIKRSTSRTSK